MENQLMNALEIEDSDDFNEMENESWPYKGPSFNLDPFIRDDEDFEDELEE